MLCALLVLLLLIPATRLARAQGGPAEVAVGAAITIGIALANEIKEAIQSLGTAVVYVKAKTDGPDSDDRAIDFDFDRDRGLDWSLDAATELVMGNNNENDAQESPYTPGRPQFAQVELHFDSTGGVWKPDPTDCVHCTTPPREFWGWVGPNPDDDPLKKDEITQAAAAAAFSADGKSVDFCYRASAATTPEGGAGYADVVKVPCSSLPEFALTEGTVFLLSEGRFTFRELPADQVRIEPLVGPEIDLFHTYLQQADNPAILPVLRGQDPLLQELRREGYEDRVAGTAWVLDEDPAALADLTVLGAALRLEPWQLTRGGRTNRQLLAEYFASAAVRVVPPAHAQPGYEPQLMLRRVVESGQDISGIVGRDYVIPVQGDPDAPVERDPLIGLLIGVEGDVDDAVALGVNTEGNFVREIANQAWDGVSESVEFTVPGMNFHHESPASLSEIAVASPQAISQWFLLGTAEGGFITFTVDGVTLVVETEPGAAAADVARALAQAIATNVVLAGRGISAAATGTRVDVNAPIEVSDFADPGLYHDTRHLRDCNGNGVPDDVDLARGTSTDHDASGIPDECDVRPCVIDSRPAATLLYPYFEVDLADPLGLTTLLSVVNEARDECTLARVTLWTDLGVPTLTFYVYLSPADVQTLNLRDVFRGQLPHTSGVLTSLVCPVLDFDVCQIPELDYTLSSAEIASLVADHTGAPNPHTGLCASVGRGGPVIDAEIIPAGTLAVGYITVDATPWCSFPPTVETWDVYDDALVNPARPFFAMQNHLWGDYYYVDFGENFSQGHLAVHVQAAPDSFRPGDYTFYGRYNGFDASDMRVPLSGTYASRFITGGVFDDTDLIVWRDNRSPAVSPFDCASPPAPLGHAFIRGFDERENAFEVGSEFVFPWTTQRLPVSASGLAPVSFGWLELGLWHDPVTPAQSWVSSTTSALGRFSVGQEAVRLDDLCDLLLAPAAD